MRFKLIEDVDELGALDKLDSLFGQSDVYMWSTYILPNGHFLNPDNSEEYWEEIGEEPEYEHSDFIFNKYNPYRSYEAEDLFDDCIKMNVTYPYLILPEHRPTPEQFRAIKNIINNKDGFHFALSDIEERVGRDLGNIQEPLLVQTPFANTVFDLSITNAYDIIKDINKAYVTKTFLNEEYEWSNEYDSEGNQLTRAQAEFFKNSKIRDNQGRLLVCYHGSNKEFDEFKKEFIYKRPDIIRGFYFSTKQRKGVLADPYVWKNGRGKVYSVYLNIKNPYIEYRGKGLPNDDYSTLSSNNDGLIALFNNETTDKWYDYDKDRVLSNKLYKGDIIEIVAFEPNQIKLITNENPTNGDNIYEALYRLK